MPEFNLQVNRSSDELDADSLTDRLSSYVESNEDVTFAQEGSSSESNGQDSEWILEIDGIDTFAEIYSELREGDEPLEIGLWGPTAERFPVPVQHYALQQISTPDAYEFHAIDNKVTLVIADSQQLVQRLQQDVPAPALG